MALSPGSPRLAFPSPAAGEGCLKRTASFAGVAREESHGHRLPSPVRGRGAGGEG
jgi:hypothetical protein